MDGVNVQVLVVPELLWMALNWIAVIFLYFILRRLLYKPVKSYIAARQTLIAEDISKAKQMLSEAEASKIEYESRILEAKEEGNRIIEASKKRGEELRDKIVADAKIEGRDIVDKSNKQAQLDRAAAMESVKSEAGEIAVAIAEKILNEQIDTSKQKSMIDKLIMEMEDESWRM